MYARARAELRIRAWPYMARLTAVYLGHVVPAHARARNHKFTLSRYVN